MLVKTSTTILATLPMMRGRLRAELSLPKTGGADGLTVTLDDTGVGVTLDDTGVGVTLDDTGVGVTLDDTGVGMDGLTVTLVVEAGVGGELMVMLDDTGVDVGRCGAAVAGVDMDKLAEEAGMNSGRLLLALGATGVDTELLVRAGPALSEALMLLLGTAASEKDAVVPLLGTTELVLSMGT